MNALHWKCAVAVILVLGMAGGIAAQTPQIAYLKFNEGGGAVALSEGALQYQNGSLTGAASWAPPKLGNYSLGAGGAAGSDRCDTPVALPVGGSWTIECWIYYTNADTSLHYLFGEVGPLSFRCFRNGVAGTDALLLRGVAGDVPLTGLLPGSWNHVAFVYNDTALTITPYLNAAAQPAVVQSANISLSGTLAVGGRSGSASWSGRVDEFRFWSGTRSVSQLTNYMNTELMTGPLLTLNGQEGSGANAKVDVHCPFNVTIKIAGQSSIPQPLIFLAGMGISKGLLVAPWGGSIDLIAPQIIADGTAPVSGLDFFAKTNFEISYVAPTSAGGAFGPSVQAIVQDGSNPPFFLKSTKAAQPFFDSNAVTVYNAISDDGFATHVMASGSISYGGAPQSTLYIGANGQITFGFGDTDFSPSTGEFFAGFQNGPTGTANPGVAAMWADYNRSGLNDEITVCESGSGSGTKVVVTYKNQSHWNSGLNAGTWSCSFHKIPSNFNYTPVVTMDFTGYMPHLVGVDQDPIVGVSDGDDTDGGLDTLMNLSNPGFYATPAAASSESICEHFGNVATPTNDISVIDFVESSAFKWVVLAQ